RARAGGGHRPPARHRAPGGLRGSPPQLHGRVLPPPIAPGDGAGEPGEAAGAAGPTGAGGIGFAEGSGFAGPANWGGLPGGCVTARAAGRSPAALWGQGFTRAAGKTVMRKYPAGQLVVISAWPANSSLPISAFQLAASRPVRSTCTLTR